MITQVDQDFLALPLSSVSDAAISTAKNAGASHVDVRIERTRTGYLSLRDAKPETQSDETNFGIGVRVIVNGAWGFASSPDVSVDNATKLAATAVAMAKTSKPLSTEEIALAPEPVYANKTWVSAYKIDPFSVSDADKKDRLASLSSKLLASSSVNHTSAHTMYVKEQKHYADSAGTSTTQQRVRVQTQIEAISIGARGFESMRTLAQPAGYGWEWMDNSVWNWDAEIDQLPTLLAEKVKRLQLNLVVMTYLFIPPISGSRFTNRLGTQLNLIALLDTKQITQVPPLLHQTNSAISNMDRLL